MAYEPVLAPNIATGESGLTASPESGFRHYLKTISASLASTSTSNTPSPAKAISTAFIFPQTEAVIDITETPSDIKEASSEPMATLALTSTNHTTNTAISPSESDNVFLENGIPSSNFSSPFESPRTSMNTTTTTSEDVINESVSDKPPLHQSRNSINLQSPGSQVIGAFFSKLFRRKDTSISRSRESSQ